MVRHPLEFLCHLQKGCAGYSILVRLGGSAQFFGFVAVLGRFALHSRRIPQRGAVKMSETAQTRE